MPLESHEKIIDGKNFRVTQLKLKPARDTFLKLTKLVGPAITEFIRGGQGINGFTLGANELIQKLSIDDLDKFCATFMTCSQIQMNNEAGTWVPLVESAFEDNLGTQIQWLVFAVESCYGEYLKGELLTRLQSSLPKGE